MGAVQLVATVVAAIVTTVAAVLGVRAVRRMIAVVRLGQPDPRRFTDLRSRTLTMLREILGHARMRTRPVVGVAHWVVMVAFVLLASLVLAAYVEVVNPARTLPVIGSWTLFGLVTELLSVTGVVAIGLLIWIRLANLPRWRRLSRFAGSTAWQAYYVEYTILAVLVLGLAIRGTKAALGTLPYPVWAAPVSHALAAVAPASKTVVSLLALAKVVVSMAWVIVIALHLTMGVAWHRFTAFPNIFFKRSGGDAPALGALQPMTSGGEPLDFAQADPEVDQFGAGAVEQFTWKGLLDFTSCTECGRCQDQCPAWNTAKPLSPKLVVLNLRDHAYAKAPYLLAGGGRTPAGEEQAGPEQLAGVPAAALAEAQRPLVGDAGAAGIIDPDSLWACTTCGACVEQCPVDIEHVDHIVDMRRHQVMIEASFPAEAGAMLRNLESRGNPWGAPAGTREDWTKGLDFEVPRVAGGADFDYLLWVGCAGAFDDRARKTTRAVATLLHQAGVSFAILGERETCTGDPARRIGDEFRYQLLAQQNVETLTEAFGDRPRRRVVTTCPHCFNTIGNEYPQLGVELEVVHHTQLLAHLVATGALTPVRPVAGGVTWHDPCYLGRHNQVYTPPRELLGTVADGSGLTEMPRSAERSFCCGAGGARMWMEERIGKRISTERVEEALATGAGTIAVGCPFCATMLDDGLAGKRAAGEVARDVNVVDVATVLLRATETR